MKKSVWVVLSLVVMTVLLSGCVPGDATSSDEHPAGFFWGVWHGWIAPISLIIGLFKDNVRIYEVHNSGWWYDLGFYLAIISGFGSLSFSRRKHHSQ
jgi:hypothetical protein